MFGWEDNSVVFFWSWQAPFSKVNLWELSLVVDQVTKTGNVKAEYMKVVARMLEEFAKLVADDDIIVDTEVRDLQYQYILCVSV